MASSASVMSSSEPTAELLAHSPAIPFGLWPPWPRALPVYCPPQIYAYPQARRTTRFAIAAKLVEHSSRRYPVISQESAKAQRFGCWPSESLVADLPPAKRAPPPRAVFPQRCPFWLFPFGVEN